MIPAEGTDWVDDLVHLPDGFSVHHLVELVEVRLNGFVIQTIGILVSFVEHRQESFLISQLPALLFHLTDNRIKTHTKIISSRMISSARLRILFIARTQAI